MKSAERSAWCPAISVTSDPPLCIPAAAARRADLRFPEKLGILVLGIGVVQMRRGQKLIRPDLGEGAMRLPISHVRRHGSSWGARGAGRLAACHCSLQRPNLTAIKASPFHHAAITEGPQHLSSVRPQGVRASTPTRHPHDRSDGTRRLPIAQSTRSIGFDCAIDRFITRYGALSG
jgi:hypothetical protein